MVVEYPVSRDLSYLHEEQDERETSANSRLIFWSSHRPETWTYQSGVRLVWRLWQLLQLLFFCETVNLLPCDNIIHWLITESAILTGFS